VGDAQIDTYEIVNFNRRLVRQVDRTEKVELAATIYEVALPLESVKPFSLVFSHHERDQLSPFQSQQAYAIQPLKRQQTLIVSNGPGRMELRAFRFVSAEAFDCFADRTHGHLAGDAERLPKFVVTTVVDARLAESLRLKPDSRLT